MKILGKEIKFRPEVDFNLGIEETSGLYIVELLGIKINFRCAKKNRSFRIILHTGKVQTFLCVTAEALDDPFYWDNLDRIILETMFSSSIAELMAKSI